jgi:hypothetical protein
MAIGNMHKDQANRRAEEAQKIKLRVRKLGPSSFPVFVVPIAFLVVSFTVTNLLQNGAFAAAIGWPAFAILAVVAFIATVRILKNRSLVRRGYNLTSPTLILYLAAVSLALYAQARWGTAAFVAIFLITMVLLAVYASRVRQEHSPRSVKTYNDQIDVPNLRPLIIALFEVDRVDRKLLGDICETKGDKALDSALEKLEKAGYVNLGTRGESNVPTVSPTTFLRRSAREHQARYSRAASSSPGWLRKGAR